jgi:hypothetical protein
VVLQPASDASRQMQRTAHLIKRIDETILQALSLGYSPEELEEAFNKQLKTDIAHGFSPPPYTTSAGQRLKVIHIVGSNDVALDLLISRLKYQHSGLLLK